MERRTSKAGDARGVVVAMSGSHTHQVVFVCETCCAKGAKAEKATFASYMVIANATFDSFTAAWQHCVETGAAGVPHLITPEVRED